MKQNGRFKTWRIDEANERRDSIPVNFIRRPVHADNDNKNNQFLIANELPGTKQFRVDTDFHEHSLCPVSPRRWKTEIAIPRSAEDFKLCRFAG